MKRNRLCLQWGYVTNASSITVTLPIALQVHAVVAVTDDTNDANVVTAAASHFSIGTFRLIAALNQSYYRVGISYFTVTY